MKFICCWMVTYKYLGMHMFAIKIKKIFGQATQNIEFMCMNIKGNY